MKEFTFPFVAALLVLLELPITAATKTWDGSANGNWSVGANWSGGTAPVAGDDLVFPVSAAARRNTTNNFILGSATFRSIRFIGNDYKIYGAVIALTNGITFDGGDGGGGFNAAGTNTINAPIELRASQRFELYANPPGALLDINGDLALGPHTLTIENGGLAAIMHLSGTISGTGGITKFAGGTLRLDGIFANTYTGPTRINVGRLELNKGLFGSAAALAGELIVGNGTPFNPPQTVLLLRDDQIADTSAVTLTNAALLDLNGFEDTVGPLTMIGGRVDTGSGTLTLGGALIATSFHTNSSIITGILSLGAGTKTFTVNQGPEYSDLEINADVTGTPGFRKAGDGLLLMNGNNNYSGSTTVQQGILAVAGDHALGSPANGTIVNAGASLILFAARVNSEALVLNGNGWLPDVGALHSGTFSNSWGGPVTLLNDSVIGAGPTAPLNLLGVISGAGGLTKIGEGTLIFSGGASNTYTGATRVHEGTLRLRRNSFDRSVLGELFIGDGAGGASSDVVRIEGSAQINNMSAVTIAASGLFDQNTPSEVIGSLAGFGRVDLGANQLIVGGNDTSTSYGGQILGTLNFVKSGLGTMTLTGDNPFSGSLIADRGTLLVHGSQPRSDVVIHGGTVGGHGTVGNIGAYGNVAPGSSPGILSCSNLTFLPGSDYFVELNGPNPGTGYDQLNVRGDVILGTAALHVSVGQPPPVSGVFTIISNDGSDPTTGVFTGLPNGAQFPVNGLLFRIFYAAGDGNDVVLTRVSAPASTLTALNALSDGNKHLRGLGLPSLTYTIEAATNLNAPIPWLIIGEARANSAGLYEWIDSDAPSHLKRFYRAQSP